ncbi:MAG: hypothetical protein CME86_22225 [Herbaspirillum sp.]|nr:hypothetical protein [Herbaspirillum sp.]
MVKLCTRSIALSAVSGLLVCSGCGDQEGNIVSNEPPILGGFIPPGDMSVMQGPDVSFSLTATDPDAGDVVDVSWFLNGQDQDLNSRILVLDTSDLAPGTHLVEVKADDGNHSVEELPWHSWRLMVSQGIPVNRAPVIASVAPNGSPTVVAGSSLTFSVEASDQDDDTLAYRWRLDGSLQSELGSTFSFDPNEAQVGDRVVEVTVSDGVLNDDGEDPSFFWDVNVEASNPQFLPEHGWATIWADALSGSGENLPEKHGGYVHQGLQSPSGNQLLRMADGLAVHYRADTYEVTGGDAGEGPRAETGLWSADHPDNRIHQREPLDGKLRRYQVQVMFPAGWNPKRVTQRCIPVQWHGNNRKNPNLSFDAAYNRLRCYYRSETVEHQRAIVEYDPLPIGRWIRIEVRAVWSVHDGYLQVLVDGDVWFEREGETAFADEGPDPGPDGPYLRFGCYCPSDRQDPVGGATRVIYLRHLSIAEREHPR